MKLPNPHEALNKAGILNSDLTTNAAQILSAYDKAKLLADKYPDNAGIQDSFKNASHLAYDSMQKEINLMLDKITSAKYSEEMREERKLKSKEILAKSEKVANTLDECREKLRQERQQKIESGEIKPPKKKTLLTKIKDQLTKIPSLIPEKLRDDVKVIQKTQLAVMKFLSELKKIWGLNKLEGIEEELGEKFTKMEESAAK